jgi:hypothetical protein
MSLYLLDSCRCQRSTAGLEVVDGCWTSKRSLHYVQSNRARGSTGDNTTVQTGNFSGKVGVAEGIDL